MRGHVLVHRPDPWPARVMAALIHRVTAAGFPVACGEAGLGIVNACWVLDAHRPSARRQTSQAHVHGELLLMQPRLAG